MSNQVVVPFPGSRFKPTAERDIAASEWRPAGRRTNRPSLEGTGHSRRSRWFARLSTARDVVRAVVETLSYVGEARVRPPLPALPPPRSTK